VQNAWTRAVRPGWRGFLVGLATALLGVVLAATPIGQGFERNVGLDWLFQWRGPIEPPAEVVVAAIDDQTGPKLGLSSLPREWPRSVHGRLVDRLTGLGASAIVFDFDFGSPKNPADDQKFAEAVDRSGRVVIAEKLVGKRQPILDRNGQPKGSVWVDQLLPPLPALAAAAKGLGPFPVPKVNVAVHQFWTFQPSADSTPTMPSVALQVHAMPAYPELFALLAELGMKPPEPLPASARASDLKHLMGRLHTVFAENPDAAAALTERVEVGSLSGLAKALAGLYGGPDQRVINFYGPPGSIRTVPYHLLAGEQPPAPGELPDLAGKVVFVGFSDLYNPGQPDRFFSVFSNEDGVDLSGVEIAATGFGNLVGGRGIEPLSGLADIALLAAFGLGLGVLVYGLPALVGVPLVLLLGVAYTAGAARAFAGSDLWLPLAIPMLVQLPLALFAGLGEQYLSERKKKKRATEAIGMYLPEHLARDFTEKSLDPSALNRVTYSVCFASDMAGFTTIAEQLKPKELAAFLNDYFDTLSAPLRKHGVDVIEFRADGIMCAWTAEEPAPGIRRRAVLAALEAVAAIAVFKERYALLSQSLRIGLETGMVYVGHAGGGGHYVYSIVGDPANTAARIEGLNKHLKTQLLAAGSVVEGLEGLVARALGDFVFVGKTEPLPILEIMATEETATAPQRRLCETYAAAMERLRTGEVAAAAEGFEAVLREFPDDGPARFHLERCRRQSSEPAADPPWVVRMDSK
jgi:adenylate cyclase